MERSASDGLARIRRRTGTFAARLPVPDLTEALEMPGGERPKG